MPIDRLRSLVRVLIFYLLALLLLLLVGTPLQMGLGLPGVVLMQLIIFMGLPLLFTGAVERKPFRPFLRLRMLTARGLAKAVLLGLAGWFMAQTLATLMILLLSRMGGQMVQPYQILLDAPPWLALFAGALIPALCEELSFRGYVQGALRPLGPTAAIILTGLLFGALHLSLIRLLPLTLLGILWAIAVQRSGSLLPGVVMHFLNNGIALGLTFFVQAQANPAALQDLDGLPADTPLAAVLLMALAAVGFAFFLATRFSPRDLVRPDAVAEEADWQRPSGADRPVFQDEESVPAEVLTLERELAVLQRRRRRMLQATGLLVGGVTLSLYLWAALQELALAFS